MLQITIGDHDLSQTGETIIPEKILAVTSYVNHEDYMNPSTYSNDITVIELAEELDITVYIPACLAQTGDTTAFDGKNMAPGFRNIFPFTGAQEVKVTLSKIK